MQSETVEGSAGRRYTSFLRTAKLIVESEGASTLFKLGSMIRTNLDTLNVAKDYIFLGALWLPWDGSTPTP